MFNKYSYIMTTVSDETRIYYVFYSQRNIYGLINYSGQYIPFDKPSDARYILYYSFYTDVELKTLNGKIIKYNIFNKSWDKLRRWVNDL